MWYAQWKDIKGIKPFIAAVPEISKIANVEMFSCGIRYYQLRSTDDWRQAVRHDFFKGYHGNGLADYFGEITQKTLYGNIARTWAAVCLQGMSKRVKHSHYREGSYQYTEMEALWYGAYPVVAEQVAKSAIPSECIITISDDADSEEIATTIEAGSPTALRDNPKAYGLAQDFILDVHSAEKGLTTIIESLGGRA